MGPRGLIPILSVAGLACQGVPRRSADLQIDIIGAQLIDTDKVRVCIEGIAIREQAVGDGRMAFGALSKKNPLLVSVDVLEENWSQGGIGPISLDTTDPWVTADWIECDQGCAPCTLGTSEPAPEDPEGHILAIQFLSN